MNITTPHSLHSLGECLLSLQQYKLRANLIGCNMTKDDYKKYYTLYQSKPIKRMELAYSKIKGLVSTFEKNAVYLQALQTRAINNMLRNYRKKMNLINQEPSQFNSSKFDKEETEILQAIVSNNFKEQQIAQINKNITQINQQINHSVQDVLDKIKDKKKNNYTKALKIISNSEIQYYRYFETFQRSVCNLGNQLHAHLDKLNQFYTLWENLGSSLIYEMKSDREVLIDKTIEEKRNTMPINKDEDEQQILQVIEVMPPNSKTRQVYLDKLQQLKSKNSKFQAFSNRSVTDQARGLNSIKNKRGNLLENHQTISKLSWYQTQAQDIKKINFSNQIQTIAQKEYGFFKYTYEQLRDETELYIQQLKNSKIQNDFINNTSEYGINDRFYLLNQRKNNKKKQQNCLKEVNRGFPHMSFDCWYDREGNKGIFNVNDLPSNFVQRKIQYENDRQTEMDLLQDKNRKQYNKRQNKLDFVQEQGGYNVGYRILDSNRQLKELRKALEKQLQIGLLPLPKPKSQVNQKRENDFSQTESDQSEQQSNQNSQQQDDLSQNDGKIENQNQKILQQNRGSKNQKQKTKQIGTYSLQILEKAKINAQNRIRLQQQEAKFQNINESYPWVKMNKKDKQVLQLFAENFLSSFEKSLIHKQIKKTNGRYNDEIKQSTDFKYLSGLTQDDIKKAIHENNTEKGNINKTYLINKAFVIKIQPIFFATQKKIMKINIYLSQNLEQFQKLKRNLQKVLKDYGSCRFQISTQLIDEELISKQKFYGLIGFVLKDIRDNIKNQTTKDPSKQFTIKQKQAVIAQGKKVYQKYQQHLIDIAKIDEKK